MSVIVATQFGREPLVLRGSVPPGAHALELPLPPEAVGCELWRVAFELLDGDCLQHWQRATWFDLSTAGLVASATPSALETENSWLRARLEAQHGIT